MQYLLVANFIDIIVEDFSNDLLKAAENKFLDFFIDHVQIVNKPKHIWTTDGSCLY